MGLHIDHLFVIVSSREFLIENSLFLTHKKLARPQSVPVVYTHVLSAFLHAADLSHSARSWDIHGRWTTMIISEFHQQGDLEKGLHMPISPGCNRNLLESDECETVDKAKIIAKGQLFFGKAFVRPLFET